MTGSSPAPGPSAFVEALLAAERPVITEVKRKDAHGNDLLGDRTIADVVAGYQAVGAPCLSVVTGRWFGGTEDTLREVVALTDLPVLQKDFITRRSQLVRARDLGASAVLLTAALLPASALAKLVEQSLVLGLVPFVEVTTEAEIAAVPSAGDCVIAVNNKDIKIAERDAGEIDRSLALLEVVRASGTPCPVSASGIDDPAVAGRLLDAGYAGLLVGTALLRSHRVDEWMAALPPRRRQLPGLGGRRDQLQQVVAAGTAEPAGQ
jgi:indole-3-glycerol phosphate synthase